MALVGGQPLSALLDRSSAVVDTRWSEDVIGTNGLGASLETIQPITIHGIEHFSEGLHPSPAPPHRSATPSPGAWPARSASRA